MPLLCLGAAVAVLRVSEIPRVDVGFDVAQYTQPRSRQERETAALLREAAALLRPYKTKPDIWWAPYSTTYQEALLGESEFQWLQENAKPLAMAREAASHQLCVLEAPGQPLRWDVIDKLKVLGYLLATAGRQAEQRGELAAARDDYLAVARLANHVRNKCHSRLHWEADEMDRCVSARLNQWAAHGQQTAELVRLALSRAGRD